MNCLQFYEAIARGEYLNNPERAEELYKYSKVAIEEALQGRNVKDMSTEVFGGVLYKYWNGMGLNFDECGTMITSCSSKWRNKHLRPEFDEEWVEYGFLPVEDGGRGIEF